MKKLKRLFKLLASIIGIGGVIELFLGLFTWNFLWLASAVFLILSAYAWSLVSDMWQSVEHNSTTLYKLKQRLGEPE